MWCLWQQIFSEGWLKKHFASVHEGNNPFKCKVCNGKFSQKSNLNQRVTFVHEGIKSFKCEVCDYTFSRKGDLKHHFSSVHEGNKLFKCEVCDYKFSLKGDFNKHFASVHEGSKPFNCEVCDYKSSQMSNLNKHVAKYHGQEQKRKTFKDWYSYCHFTNFLAKIAFVFCSDLFFVLFLKINLLWIEIEAVQTQILWHKTANCWWQKMQFLTKIAAINSRPNTEKLFSLFKM